MASSKGNSYNEIPQHNHNQLNNSLQQFNSNQDVNNNNEMKVPYLSTTSPHKLQTSPDYLATSQWNHKVNLARNIDDRIQDLTYKNDNQRSWSLITTFRPTETKLNENPRVIERGIESRTSKTRNNILQAANELSSENMLWYLLNELGLPKHKIAIDLDESECRAFNTYLALITQMFDVYFPFPVFQVCAEAALYDTSKVLLRSVVALGMLYTNSEGAKSLTQ
ncbi:uncharacterized protein KQ657_003511 [Scheffersomyces spartinae]|uniref:Uncharacterized protein n=1 Tax=Scheffersomyces spartinae TaxID=45513 RepID=A0A9P7V532_9ASCO|nr:uncharacterized protein KQ657_003511 [Scheffersomyces spartinae]KAG7191390.1 hypothetical protein KQ657_003511 [Scheffersomyces spartinae]